MCGIAGWLSAQGNIDRDVLCDINNALAHRGPDGEGVWIDPRRTVGLTHRRLSIVDLSTTANQPMIDRDARAVIVFNGEIYNHRELRAELVDAGCHFETSHSDTETLLQGFLHWGIDRLLEKLNGMFAFAVHDTKKQQVWIVRDRVGIKPLFYAEVGGDLIFASEIKALLHHPQVQPELSESAFQSFLSFRAIPAPGTLFKGISTLAAGELMSMDISTGHVTRRSWWDPIANAAAPPATLEEAEDRLEELVRSSLEYRLQADVDVGVFLSGGLDSVYLLDQARHRISEMSSFTAVYPGMEQYNEDGIAREHANRANTNHHEVPLYSETFRDSLADVVFSLDQPIAAPVCTSVYYLSKAAREADTKVILAGEGSDEIFVGYESWLQLRNLTRWNKRIPALPGRPLRKLANAAGSRMLSWSDPKAEMLRRSAAGLPLFCGGSLDFSEQAKSRILPDAGMRHDPYQSVIAPLYSQFCELSDPSDHTAWMSYLDLKFRLPELMLPRLDRMGMAFSIEGRVPYLDHRIIEFTMGLPPEWRGGTGNVGKPLLKSIASRSLGSDFVYMKKRGFQAPVKEWKHTAFGAKYVPALQAFADRTGLFDRKGIDELLALKQDRLYFSLVNFVIWYGSYIENVVEDHLPELNRLQVKSSERKVAA